MEYTVKINGKTHTLPARTPEIDDMIDRIENINSRVRAGEITRRQSREEQYDFVSSCIGEPMPPLEEMDISELEIASLEIVNAYLHPAIKAKIDTMMGTIREVTNRPEITKLVAVAEASKRKN